MEIKSKVQNKRKLCEVINDQLAKTKAGRVESKLPEKFFNVPAINLAENLLGKLLVRKILESNEILKGRIVETECYPGGDDKASYAYNGRRTKAIEPLYMKPGTVLVRIIYGMYDCLNLSSKEPGGCVLIRALEPIEGIETMRTFRSGKRKLNRKIPDCDLCAGPSKLCASLNIEKATMNKINVTSNFLWIEDDPNFKNDFKIVRTSRIGINSTGAESVAKPFRFYIYGNKHISKADKLKEAELLQK